MGNCCGSDGIVGMVALEEQTTASLPTFSAASTCFPLLDAGASLVRTSPHINVGGMNGSIAEDAELTREGPHTVAGNLAYPLTPKTMDFFMKFITGQAPVAGVSEPVKDLPNPLSVKVYKDIKIYTYHGCKINTATIEASSGSAASLVLAMLGISRDPLEAPAAWPAGLEPIADVPYILEDITLEVDGTEYNFRQMRFEYNNNLEARRFNSLTPCAIKRAGKTSTTIALTMPHCADSLDAITEAIKPPASCNVVLSFAHPDPNYSLVITMPAVQFPNDDTPLVPGELLLELNGVARRSAGNAEFSITNDASDA